MARSRFFLISTIVVIFTGVGAWYELERAELVVNATASPVPVTVAIASRGDLPNAGAASAPPLRLASPKNSFAWIAAALWQTMSPYGRRARTSDAASNSRLPAGS